MNNFDPELLQKNIDILSIPYGLSLGEIQKIYKQKAMQYHPDRNHGFKAEAEEKMKQVNQAYDYIKKYYEYYSFLNEGTTNEDFEEIGDFYLGYAKARKNGKWGFIDQSYNEAIPFIYDAVGNFSENLVGVKQNGKSGFINTFGDLKIDLKYDWVEAFSFGFAKVCINGIIGKIDTNGIEYFQNGDQNANNNFHTNKTFEEMNNYEKIEYLGHLNKKGILSDEEFEIEKNKILGKKVEKEELGKKTEKEEKPLSGWDIFWAIIGFGMILRFLMNLFEWIGNL